MAGWHSLSGYLQYKSGNALGRLITKRRVWCVLEESKCQLHYYKSEEDFHKQRPSQGHIDVNGAAISLDLENQNQFVVLSEGKEHYFTSENHESMMIWLLGLQAKRDSYCRKVTMLDEGHDGNDTIRDRTNSDLSCWSNRPCPFMTYSSGHVLDDCDATLSPMSLTPKSFRWEKYELQKWGESVDSGLCTYSKKRHKDTDEGRGGVRSRSLPPVFEAFESAKSFPIQTSRSVPLTQKTMAPTSLSTSMPAQHSPPGKMRVRKHFASAPKLAGSPTTSSFDDSDDVFDETLKQKRHKNMSRNWRKVQSAVMSQRLPPYTPQVEISRESRYSSRSTSSDSAIDTASPLELANRLSELESELISTKCELAKVMNQQTCYQELLQQKDQTIRGLERKASTSHMNGSLKKEAKPSPAKQSKSDKELHERVRVLQNQNRFLNEEVKKLARIRQQEHNKYDEQNMKVHGLEAEIEKWKMDYVTLIQSSIRFPGQEQGTEELELSLYGGDKHKNRVKSLLEEARKINPRLPTYDSLANNEAHVDTYGFKHVNLNPGLMLHYLCTELTHHFLVQAGVYEEHQKKWTAFMRQNGKSPMKATKELKSLCRGGIPDRFRKQMWRHLVHHHVKDLMVEKGDHYYRNLCNMLPESPLASCYRKQVSLDLMRTMPGNIKFSAQGSKGIMDLQDVLLAFCIHNPTIGYCQGMNFIVGMALIFMDPQDAFWMLVAIAERYFSPHYFDHSLIGAQSDQQVLKDMVQEKLPDLYNHLDSIDIELSTITLNWFLAVFFDAVPFQTLLRIWDCFLLEGPKVLFRFSLAILKLHEKDILQKTDTMGIMKHLKACAKLTYDVDGLVKLAFEGLKPFPKRRDITSKQTCYLNTLKEKHKKKELQRLAFAEREQLYMSMEAEAGTFMGIECAVTGPDGKVWICYGDQNIGRISCVSCDQGHMTSLDWKLDSRLMCMCCMAPDKLVLGTISWMLVAFSVTTREPEWQIQLHDAILSVCCYEDETMTTRIFSGLADGTVAVVEQQYKKTEPYMDVLYIPIGQAPVTCLMLQGQQLWCASGNTVAILHARSLDTLDVLSVSVNPYDHILSLVPGDYGIWITLRGSSILELWDPKSLCCRMLYDTRTDRYPHLKKEDDAYFNRARITSILANGSTVWVGTGEGNLIIYEIQETSQIMTPTVHSPSVEYVSSVQSGDTCKGKDELLKEVTTKDIKTKLLHVDHNAGRRRILEHTDSMEVNFNPQSPSPADLSNNSCESDQELADKPGKMQKCFSRRRGSAQRRGSDQRRGSEHDVNKENNIDSVKEAEDFDAEDIDRAKNRKISLQERSTSQSNGDPSEKSEKRKFGSFGRQTSECCLQVPRESVELGEEEVPLEQIYEAYARRSSYSQELIEPTEVEEHQSSRRGSKPPLNSRKSENNILVKKEAKTEVRKPSAEEEAFEEKMEEYARRNSGSCELIAQDDFDRIQAIYDHTVRAQNRDSLGSLVEGDIKRKESTESRNSCQSNSSVLIEREDVEKLQFVYDEAVTAQSKERKKSIEKRRKVSMERKPFDASIAEETELLYKMETIKDDTSDNLTESPVQPLPNQTFRKGRRRSSSENNLLDMTTADDDNEEITASQRQSYWNRERRKSSSENDLLAVHQPDNAIDCQGRSESLIRCDATERKAEIYEEKLEKLALKETLGTHQLSPYSDSISPSSSEIFSPANDMFDVYSENTDKIENNTEGVIKDEEGKCEEDHWKRNTEPAHHKGYSDELTGDGGVSLRHRGSKPFESEETRTELQANIERGLPFITKNGISDELKERLLQNYHHSEANLDLRAVLDVLHKRRSSEIERLLQKQGKGDSDGARHGSSSDSPKRGERRLSDSSFNIFKGLSSAWTRRKSSLKKDDLKNACNFEDKGSKEISQEEKVGIWLSSISSDVSGNSPEKEGIYLNVKQGMNKDNRSTRNSSGSSSEEDVFLSAREKDPESNSDSQPSGRQSTAIRPSHIALEGKVRGKHKPDNTDSEGKRSKSSKESPLVPEKNLKNKDAEAKYRLEFSGVHIDTDQDSEREHQAEKQSSETAEMKKIAKLRNEDRRKSSLDLGSIEEKCNRFYDTFLNKIDKFATADSDEIPLRISDRHKLFEYLRTPSLESRQLSIGPKIGEDDLDWADVFAPQYSTHSPSSSADHRMADFLKTPSLSSKHSSLWSSYDNISTPTEQDGKHLSTILHRGHLSHSASTASLSTDTGVIYNVDLALEAKMKISDKPVKCLLPTSLNGESLILSCSGSYGDDEAVLKWRKHQNEFLWTNEPILEFCPKTKMKILPTYMQRRLSSTSSFHSHGSEDSTAGTCLSSSSHK